MLSDKNTRDTVLSADFPAKIGGMKWFFVLFLSAAVGFAVFLSTRARDRFAVAGVNMMPTLEPGDVVRADRRAYRQHGPARGDVVIYQVTGKPTTVGRVVGLPGDDIRFTGARLAINGQFTERETLSPVDSDAKAPGHPHTFTPVRERVDEHDYVTWILAGNAHVDLEVKLDPDMYYIVGDDRDEAIDSRAVGPVKREQIAGRVVEIESAVHGERSGQAL